MNFESTMDSENKSSRELYRFRSLKQGQIIAPEVGGYLDCTILDLHSKGARIRLRKMPDKLGQIELIIKPENIRVSANTRWLHGNTFGVEFLKSLNYLSKHDTDDRKKQTQTHQVNTPLG